MSVKKTLKRKLMRSAKGKHLFYKIRILREKYVMATKSDYRFVSDVYKERFGSKLDLANPKTLGEKLNWLKLFYRDEKMPICSDKYEVHNYLKEIGYGDLCNEVIGVYDDARDIDFDALPDKFVAKATHGSSWNLICEDKSSLDWEASVKTMNMWLKLNLFAFGREWNYKDLKPRIIVEKFIEHKPLNDYKFMCYNGEPLYMQLNNDYDGKHYVDFYDLKDWSHLPVTYSAYENSNREMELPENYGRMFELAKELSKPFPFVRVDFYSFDDKIIFGELTFFPGGALRPFIPLDKGYNELLGEKLLLPEPNHNLDLYKKINGLK